MNWHVGSTASLRAVGLLTAACALAIPALAPAASRSPGKLHTIRIENVQYQRQSLRVQRGDRIVWINNDLVPHTVSADSGSFDSGDLSPGARWTYTASAAGTFAYHCRYHPTMIARLIVKDGQAP